MIKLHIGCGHHTFIGWTNIDLVSPITTNQYITHDLSTGLPHNFADNSVDFIHHEHFLEHLTRDQGLSLMKSCYSKLKVGGVMRIVMPDLDDLVKRYNENNIFFGGYGGWEPRNRCIMINEGFHAWGHMFLYDWQELVDMLGEAGFTKVARPKCRESEHDELRGIDIRLEPNDLRIEVTK